LAESGHQQGFSPDFHNRVARAREVMDGNLSGISGFKAEIVVARILRFAPKSRQWPVDGLHSTDFSADKSAAFLLTLKMKGVKQTRSLTASEVFPVGAASGAQAKSLFASQDDGGKAGKGL
jgi:hypothetical protein